MKKRKIVTLRYVRYWRVEQGQVLPRQPLFTSI